mgnify:CR=1 FL=1
MILEYYCTRDDMVRPTRANPSDAGLDVHYNPEDSELSGVYLEPGESKLFSTGLKFGVPHGYMLEVKNRSGNASKRSLLVGACVVDSGYDGEVFVNLHNVGTRSQFIERGMKVAQIVMVPVVHFRALETNKDNLYDWHPITISDRGDGALGSTDKNNSNSIRFMTTQDVDPYNLPKDWEIGDPT